MRAGTTAPRSASARSLGGASAAALLLSLLCSGCGIGTLGAAAAVSSDPPSQGGDTTPSLSGFGVDGPEESPATLRFTLEGPVGGLSTVTLYYQLPGEPLRSLESLAGGAQNPMVLATQPTPVEHVFTWNFDQEPGLDQGDLVADVQVWGIVANGLNSFAQGVNGDSLSLGNDPPELAAPPTVELVNGEASGDVLVKFLALDSSEQSASLELQFRLESQPDWTTATPVAAPGSFETSATGGLPGEVLWDSAADLGGIDAPTRLRLRLSDPFEVGPWSESALFTVDNNAVPDALLDSDALFLSPDQQGGIPIPLDVRDLESDPVVVGIQWRRAGEAFPEFDPSSAGELEAALADPAQRAELQLCTRLPVEHEGRLAGLPEGIDPLRSLRLPELGGAASSLLSVGLGGQELDVLRASRQLAPVDWSDEPSGVLDVAPLGDGRTCLFLVEGGGSWTVQERRLTTGEVLETFDLGANLVNDTPVRMALGPEQRYLFVVSRETNGTATTFKLYRFDRSTQYQLAGSQTASPSGSFKVRQVAAPTSHTALVATDNRFLAFHFAGNEPLSAVDKGGLLSGSWGIAPDPTDRGRAYVSNPTINGGLFLLDVETLDAVPVPLVHMDAPDSGIEIFLRSLAFERDTNRLLAMSQEGPRSAELRLIAVGQTVEIGEDSGAPTACVQKELPDPLARLSTGPDGLRLSVLSSSGRVQIAGGLQQRVKLVPSLASPGEPSPYDPTTQVVTATEDLVPIPEPGQPWRLRVLQERAPSSSEGRRSIYLWDSADVPQAGSVFLRPLAADGDVSPFSPFEAPKELRSRFGGEPISLGSGGLPPVDRRDALAADLDGDGDLDLAVTEGDRVVFYRQLAPGQFDPSPRIAAVGSDLEPLEPAEIEAGYLTNDGLVDLAIVNRATNRVDIYEQQALGGFELWDSLIPSAPGSLGGLRVLDLAEAEIVEVQDVVVINQTRQQLEIFIQSPFGGFSQPAAPVGAFPGFGLSSVIGARVDTENGTVDLIAKGTEGSLSVYYQSTAGTFDPKESLSINGLGGVSPAVIALDLGADNLIDLVSTSTDFDSLYIARQLQDGTFTAELEPLGGAGVTDDPSDVRAMDVNGDSRVDILCANETGNSLSVFFQQPGGGVDPVPLIIGDVSTSNSPTALLAADLDGDGRTDLAAASQYGSHLAVHLQESPGGFEAPPQSLLIEGSAPDQGGDPVATATGDLNGDGLEDIACASRAGLVQIFWQTSPGAFDSEPLRLSTDSLGYRDLTVGDMNGDGLVDLVAGQLDLSPTEPGSVEIYLQRPTVGFESLSPPDARLRGFAGEAPGTLAVNDFNGDGRLDVVAVGEQVDVFLQPESGFSGDIEPTVGLGVPASLLRSGDVDRDGYADLITLQGAELRLHYGAAVPGTWEPPVLLLLPARAEGRAIELGDLDRNGWVDLLLLDAANGRIWSYPQRAQRQFESVPVALRPSGELGDPQGFALADLDGDALPELVVADRGTDEVVIFRGTLPGLFLSPGERRGGPGITAGCYAVQVADLDRDGSPDLLSANPGILLGDPIDSLAIFWGGH